MTWPCFDVAHLGHVELFTDKPEAGLGLADHFSFHTYGTPAIDE